MACSLAGRIVVKGRNQVAAAKGRAAGTAAPGVVATPWRLAGELAELALGPRVAGLTVEGIEALVLVDPAAGDGVLLLAALERLADAWLEAGGSPADLDSYRRHAVEHTLTGIDMDGARLELAKARLLEAAGARGARTQLLQGDALALERWPCRPDGDGCDVVLANPPWISARVAAASGQSRTPLRQRFRTARGAHDLAAAFVERSLAALNPGGRMAFILPRALLSAQHARPLRELLTRDASLTDLVELDGDGGFSTVSVYPMLIAAEKRSVRANETTRVLSAGDPTPRHVPCGELAGAATHGFTFVQPSARGVRLADLARVAGGTAGFDAARTAVRLVEAADTGAVGVPFVTSAAVHAYRLEEGPIRFQRQVWRRPLLCGDDPARRERDHATKLLVAGMSKRLRAAHASAPVAAGVAVFCVLPLPGVDPFLLLGCLNSAAATREYSARFPGKRMAGGYLAVNGHTLAEVPIVPPDHPLASEIAARARSLHETRGASDAARAVIDVLVERALT